MRILKQKYSLSFFYAMLVHVTLISLLLMSFITPHKKVFTPPSGEIVQALLLDEKQVSAMQAPMHPPEKPAPPKKMDEPKRVEAPPLDTQKQEKAKLAEAKQKEKEVEENHLAQIQLAKEKEKKELEVLRVQKAKEEKRLAALEDKRLEEQERANQMRLERQKEEKKKKEALEAKRKAEKIEEERKAAQAAAAEEAQWAAENAKHQQWIMGEQDKYKTLVKNKIKGGWIRPSGFQAGLKCTVLIGATADGSVHSVSIVKSSGNVGFDNSTITAVNNAGILPFPPVGDPELTNYFLSFTLEFTEDGEVKEHAM